jgi:hypothetical protein
MPQNIQKNVGTNWTELTDATVTAITFQVVSSMPIFVTATANATPPASTEGGLTYSGGQGESNRALADLFPGVAGANRVWARSSVGTQQVFVSHA